MLVATIPTPGIEVNLITFTCSKSKSLKGLAFAIVVSFASLDAITLLY
ncbi:MAG: hypothetical protein H6911_06080 [Rickettsiaceae bacterium]|nr:hypothetical protein [Rickettsiaceae bacterium]